MIDTYAQRLNYGTCNEDTCSELRALGPLAGKTVVCITGSGGRTLNLLTDRPARLVSIDINPVQNMLLRLKLAAIRTLSYDQYRSFLGLDAHSKREDLYRVVARDLDGPSKTMWDGRLDAIRSGILYAGTFEKHYAQSARVIRAVKGRAVDALFECRDLETQRSLYHHRWNDWSWRLLLRLDGVQTNYRRTLGDPAYYLHIPRNFDYAAFFASSMERMLTRGLACDNHFLALTLDGSYRRARTLPLCLRAEHYATLQECADRVEIVTASLEDYLADQGEAWVDRFSLSDVSSYLTVLQFNSLLTWALRASRPGAILCSRNYLRSRDIPESLTDRLRRDPALEAELRDSDLSSVYEFIVATVDKDPVRAGGVR